jgi:cytidylate kinase
MHAAERLPGMQRLAEEGAVVRARARSILAARAEETIDWLLAGRLPDAVARSAVEHQVAERIAAELAESMDVELAVTTALDNATTERLVQAVLVSPAMQHTIEYVASSPEVRAALTAQSGSLAEEMVSGVRTRAETLDDVAERTVRGWLRRPRPA